MNTTEMQQIVKGYYEKLMAASWAIWNYWIIPRNIQITKAETGRNRKLEYTYNQQRN